MLARRIGGMALVPAVLRGRNEADGCRQKTRVYSKVFAIPDTDTNVR
jgi:hypothetical protein